MHQINEAGILENNTIVPYLGHHYMVYRGQSAGSESKGLSLIPSLSAMRASSILPVHIHVPIQERRQLDCIHMC